MRTTGAPDHGRAGGWGAVEILAALAATPLIRLATPGYPRHRHPLAAPPYRPTRLRKGTRFAVRFADRPRDRHQPLLAGSTSLRRTR
jgi:hypothetical protein